jgi:arginyl-tRNA synthetase
MFGFFLLLLFALLVFFLSLLLLSLSRLLLAKHRFEHVGFGMVCGDDGKPYKTRSGDTVRASLEG